MRKFKTRWMVQIPFQTEGTAQEFLDHIKTEIEAEVIQESIYWFVQVVFDSEDKARKFRDTHGEEEDVSEYTEITVDGETHIVGEKLII